MRPPRFSFLRSALSLGVVVMVGFMALFLYWDGNVSMLAPSKVVNGLSGSLESKPHVLGWIPYWDQEAAVKSFKDNVEVFTDIAVFWYVADESGDVGLYEYATEDDKLIDFAHQHGVRVLAVVTNLPEEEGTDWDADLFDTIMKSRARRNRHIQAIVELVEEKNFDGVNIDYEALKINQRRTFTKFIEDLADQLHANGKILGVSLLAKSEEDNPKYLNGSEAQSWRELARSADQLYVMAYGEHWSDSGPGPMAGLPWVKEVVSYAKETIPASKLFVGMPLYGYDWGTGPTAQGLTYNDVVALVDNYQPEVIWDDELGSFFFGYENNGVNHQVWYENADSVKEKVMLINELELHNVALWRLGGEDPDVWGSLSD